MSQDEEMWERAGWQSHLKDAIENMLSDGDIRKHITGEHLKDTPKRFVKAFSEFFKGCHIDPATALGTHFEENGYDELIVVKNIDFVSFCAHHLLPFIGTVSFGYLPKDKIVGLSKIPRLIEVLSHRPQVQERLSIDIVNTFQKVVEPRGCGVIIRANHLCMSIRGIKKPNAITETSALRGEFLKSPSLKQEFLAAARG